MMMVPRNDNGSISWHTFVVAGSIVLATTAGSIWIGKLANQIETSTARLLIVDAKLEAIMDQQRTMMQRLNGLEQQMNPYPRSPTAPPSTPNRD